MLEPGLELLARVTEARPGAQTARVRARVQHEPAIHPLGVRPDGGVGALEHVAVRRQDLVDPRLRGGGRPRQLHEPMPIVMLLRCVKPSRAPSIEYSEPIPLCFLPP